MASAGTGHKLRTSPARAILHGSITPAVCSRGALGHSDFLSKSLMSLCVNEAGRVRNGLDFVTCAADS
jgi:hypothetical protein